MPMADYLPSDLIFAADQALYQAKDRGRNQARAIYVMPPPHSNCALSESSFRSLRPQA